MTQISYIAGVRPDERKDRAALVPGQSYINYTALTDGELRLTLLADQVNMLAAYYPENKDLQKAKGILIDALYRGVHRSPLPGGLHTGTLATVVKELRFARENTRPASGQIFGRVNGIGGGIGDPLIPLEECEVTEYDPELGQNVVWTNPQCVLMNEYKKILNDRWEKSSHYLLYEFIGDTNAVPATVTVKALAHKASKATVSQISLLSKDNLRLWLRNGVIRYNSLANGVGPRHPEETIQMLKEGAAGVSGIGIAPAVLVAIIGAIAAALTAAAQMISAFKSKNTAAAQAWNQIQGIGTEVLSPETLDWLISTGQIPPGSTVLPDGTIVDPSGNVVVLPGSTPTQESQDYLPLLLLGGAAVLFMK